MKIFGLFTFIISALLFCNAFKFNDNQEKLDDERDMRNYLGFENVERDIKFNGERALDVYYDKSDTTELKPVYIFFFGGIWYSGDKVKFTKFGQLFETNGYVGVLPNYVLFPHGGFEDMVDDVYKAIKWTFENIEKYGGDPSRVSLSGYSSGSHLTTLTLLKTVLGFTNKNQFLEPFPHIEKVVLLNGPYDFDDYSAVRKLFGKETENSVVENIVKYIFRSRNVSPTDLLKSLTNGSVSTFGVDKFVFFYTSLDKSVPETSAANLISQMKRVCPNVNIEYVFKEGYEHTSLTRGVRAGNPEDEDLYLNLIRM
eukprot:jgi/Orpsp1_1/1189047/evm.model.d7180000069083.1